MRHAKRVDRNHAEIRDGLRSDGEEVLDLSGAGQGVADLAVLIEPGRPHFLEVKDGNKPLSAQALTPAQEVWHRFTWQICSKVRNLTEARAALADARARMART